MPQRLIVRLGRDPDVLRWACPDAADQAEKLISGTGSWEQLPTMNRPVIALAPMADINLLKARMPPLSRQRAVRAVPFALEDQLVDDVDKLHFCLGRRNAAEEQAVAVVGLERMHSWLQAFEEAGLEVEQIYPEVLALPYTSDAWTLLIENDEFMLRTGLQEGFGGELDNLSVLLESALQDAEDDRPLRLIVYSDQKGLGFEVPASLPVEQHVEPDATSLLARHLRVQDAIGLRVGAYSRRSSWSVHWQRWRVAVVLLALWLAADTSSLLLKRWQLARQLTHVEEAMAQTYRQAFPDGGQLNMYNPRQQMESRLAALRRGGGDSGFLHLLQIAGPLLASESGVQIISLTYRNNGLDLELSANSLQGIDQIKQKLGTAPGLGVEVVSARAEGDRAQGRLRLEASS